MLLRRITEHVHAQNWVAVSIDLVIVVVGVFIGIQVSNWNDERVARAMEIDFLRTVRDEIAHDIADSRGFVDMLSGVTRYGNLALGAIDRDSTCKGDCWAELLHFFHASQWIDVRTNRATFDEIKRTGLPRDPGLKATLTRYYGLTEQMTIIGSELPKYRELVRSRIPADVQQDMWEQCIDIDGRQQILNDDCKAPVTDDEARLIVETIRRHAETGPLLTFWLSTIGVVTKALGAQNLDGEEVIARLEEHIAAQ